ncbi:MAG: bifunctional phosphoribosylaminoimidazolecarboxamide formyltransferase/IMP cyclohydrolase [Planctomycetota bacterium]|nr:bifunctional phosphoribosylaminoimidazolecarboxamide formyltransferase/IMP cyclohydrolase [Planctomycetota bacterium]
MSDLVPVRRALISVSDKTDLVAFAKALVERGVQIISTGGTARALEKAGLAVTPIDQVTGFPEMMDGRVKTLHPNVHGGLLALRDHPEHIKSMREHRIEPIDLVCVNLYPFEQTVAKGDVKDEEAIEQIDIGGPSMIRSASKNHRFVTVVTDPRQYDKVVAELNGHEGATTFSLRRELAAAAFARTAAYDTAIAEWMTRRGPAEFPESLLLRLNRDQLELRHGENPHQLGALYVDSRTSEPSVTRAKQLHGKALSFNNLYDANGALELVKEIDPARQAAAAVIKHANPCGFAVAPDLSTAFNKAYAGDPVAAFGGIIACNRPLDLETAKQIVQVKSFLEVILAPGYEEGALAVLQERWKNTRLLEVGPLGGPGSRDPRELDMKRVVGGLLVQHRDLAAVDPSRWQHAAGPAPSADDLAQMRIATIAVKHLKSNAVCLARDFMLVGAGAGQMDRVTSCRLAVEKAGERAKGAFVGSDAFFPFRDGPDILIKAGVKGIAQTGGSMRDAETITACNEANVTLMLTGVRLFKH